MFPRLQTNNPRSPAYDNVTDWSKELLVQASIVQDKIRLSNIATVAKKFIDKRVFSYTINPKKAHINSIPLSDRTGVSL